MVFIELDDEHNKPTSFSEFEELAKLAGAFLPDSVLLRMDDELITGGNTFNDWLSLLLLCVRPQEAHELITNPSVFKQFNLTRRPFLDSARAIERCGLNTGSPALPDRIRYEASEPSGLIAGSKKRKRPGRPQENKKRDEKILKLHVNTYSDMDVVEKLKEEFPDLSRGAVRAVRSRNGQTRPK